MYILLKNKTYMISFFYCESPDGMFYHCKTFGATLYFFWNDLVMGLSFGRRNGKKKLNTNKADTVPCIKLKLIPVRWRDLKRLCLVLKTTYISFFATQILS